MADLPFLEGDPDPRVRGRAHGDVLRAQVQDNLATYLARFEAAGATRAAVMEEAEAWASLIREADADYFGEMAACAEGARISLTEAAMLNARYEITYRLFGREAAAGRGAAAPLDPPETEGCTSFGLMPGTTSGRKTLIGQAWDWLAGIRGRTFVQRVRRSHLEHGKPNVVGFFEAGIVGAKMGVNESGIGLCINGLVSDRDGRNGLRLPVHMRCQRILDSWRYDKALGVITAEDRTCSTNFLVGHADGEIINIEATPDHCSYIYPTEGIVTHANHLERETRVTSQMERIGPHTLFRAVRLRRSLQERSGQIDKRHIESSLADHFSFPGSICRHPDPTLPQAKRSITVACILIDLNERILYASDGQICENPLQAFPLDTGG